MMQTIFGFDNLPQIAGSIVTLGSFDGVHIGHQALINQCVTRAKELGLVSIVLTFEPHPRVALGRAEGLQLLSTLSEKRLLIEQLGVDYLIVIPFDLEFSRKSYESFVVEYLVDKLLMREMVVGANHHLGRGAKGGVDTIGALSKQCNFELCPVALLGYSGHDVSSTQVRNLLQSGDFNLALGMLPLGYIVETERVGDFYTVADPLKLLPLGRRFEVEIGDVVTNISIGNNRRIIVDSVDVSAPKIVMKLLKEL